MDKRHAECRYWTVRIEDRENGFAGVELHREHDGQSAVAATVIFWDATGQYFVETCGGDIPLSVLQSTIAEAIEFVRVPNEL